MQTYDVFINVGNQALRRHELSPAGRQALGALDGADGPLSPSEIAERLLITTASVTSLIDTLEKRGLVTRSPDAEDRRKVRVAITSEGARAVDAFLPQMVALQTAIMADLSEDRRQDLLAAFATIRATASSLVTEDVISTAPPRRRPRRR